ncbi:MAG: chromosome partitioning protein ParA [Candidatus Magasanikbacteria bacterium CG_4_9_14_3_um_filter_32_9]|uniref:Chromosome partitioning protein ParA n=1 Tax=Candidatus Magasanikbacteria bacterium CG_4_9_14_3_um_filter_32_9 TaxID=1974644 RepID=A0A2M7Z6E1_9BACT|nr:MAG: chromosome partitioning protein ParA [Candidatus Magasanikbacteria bacterium CG_4_9_14_3_um_filter_32_9]
MSKVISIVNQKGGVGKTTTAINLAVFLAEMGKEVLIIDMDPQGNATSGLGFDKSTLKKHVYHALSLESSLEDVILKTTHKRLYVAPTTPDLAGANIELVNEERREYRLADLLENVSENYDYVLVDCPPALGLLTLNSLLASHEVLIPVQAEYYALEGLGQLLETIKLVKDNIKPELEILGAVITMFDKRTRLSAEVLNELYKYFPDSIFRTVIPRTVRLAEAPSFGKSILQYDPWGKGSRAYQNLAKEILRKHNI